MCSFAYDWLGFQWLKKVNLPCLIPNFWLLNKKWTRYLNSISFYVNPKIVLKHLINDREALDAINHNWQHLCTWPWFDPDVQPLFPYPSQWAGSSPALIASDLNKEWRWSRGKADRRGQTVNKGSPYLCSGIWFRETKDVNIRCKWHLQTVSLQSLLWVSNEIFSPI